MASLSDRISDRFLVPRMFLAYFCWKEERKTTFPLLPERCSREKPGGSVVVLIVADGRYGIGDQEREILITLSLHLSSDIIQ